MNLESKIESYYKVLGSQGFDLVFGFILFTGFMDNMIDNFNSFIFKAQTEGIGTIEKNKL